MRGDPIDFLFHLMIIVCERDTLQSAGCVYERPNSHYQLQQRGNYAESSLPTGMQGMIQREGGSPDTVF